MLSVEDVGVSLLGDNRDRFDAAVSSWVTSSSVGGAGLS